MGLSNSNNKNLNKDITEINIIYNINKKNIRLFDDKFVENNKNICKMIIDNKEYVIKEEYNVKSYKNKILKTKLKGINNITDMSYIFFGCIIIIFT